MDCSPQGPSVHGIFRARVLEYSSGISPPGDLPDPGIKPRSLALQVGSLPSEPPGKPLSALRKGYFWPYLVFIAASGLSLVLAH